VNPFEPPLRSAIRILALDPASVTGYAWSDGTRREHGVWILGTETHRLMALESRLEEHLTRLPCDLIAFEDASFGSPNPNVQAMHNELRGVIKLVASRRHIRFVLFHPTTIKAFATGSGRAKKPQMMAACKRLLGITPSDDNEADALWILELAKNPKQWAEPSKAKVKRVKAARKKEPRLF